MGGVASTLHQSCSQHICDAPYGTYATLPWVVGFSLLLVRPPRRQNRSLTHPCVVPTSTPAPWCLGSYDTSLVFHKWRVCLRPFIKKLLKYSNNFYDPRPSLAFPLDILFSTLGIGRGPVSMEAAGENGNEELWEMRVMMWRCAWALFPQDMCLL